MMSVKLNTGTLMPIIGLGTWQATENEVQKAVECAIDVGYRHIDTAFSYKNEKDIGMAIKKKIQEGVVAREDLFIVSKVPGIYATRERVKLSLRKTLADLDLDYIDLFLVHSPIIFQYVDDETVFPVDEDGKLLALEYDLLQTWKGMEEIFKSGLAKAIGVSNFNSDQINYICDNAEVQPANNQVECHAYFPQDELFKICKEKNITFSAFAPVGSPTRRFSEPGEPVLMDDPALKSLINKHHKSAAQILLRWLIQRGIVVLPKSSNPARIRENFEIFDFILDEEDVNVINDMNKELRLFKFLWGKDCPNFPFIDLL